MDNTAWMRIKAPAGRLLLQTDAQARAIAADVWGVAFSEESCRAHVSGESGHAVAGPR